MYSSLTHRQNGRYRRPLPTPSHHPASTAKLVPNNITLNTDNKDNANTTLTTNNDDKDNVETEDDANTTLTTNNDDKDNVETEDDVSITLTINNYLTPIDCFTLLDAESFQSDLSSAETLSLIKADEVSVLNEQRCNIPFLFCDPLKNAHSEEFLSNNCSVNISKMCDIEEQNCIPNTETHECLHIANPKIIQRQTRGVLFNNFTITIPTDLC